MSKSKRKNANVKKPPSRPRGGLLQGIARGVKQAAGAAPRKKPPSIFEKIFTAVLFVAAVALLLYRFG